MQINNTEPRDAKDTKHDEETSEEDVQEAIYPHTLVRSLSTQHVITAVSEMITQRKCLLEAGYHKDTVGTGWTRWFVFRPSTECMDLSRMKLVTLCTTTDGNLTTHVDSIPF